MAARFEAYEGAAAESVRLAETLTFDLTSDIGYRYPGAEDAGASRRLAEICQAEFERRYPPGYPRRVQAARRLEEELALIDMLGFSGFFGLHYDVLQVARAVAIEVRGPDTVRALLEPGRGRGSSVSSIVCYLAGLSHIDPIENELQIGRFLHGEVTLAAGYRHRLPARYPRPTAPPARRALRQASSGAGRELPHVSCPRRDPRARQGARPAGGGPGPCRESLRGLGRRGNDRAGHRHGARRRAPAEQALAAARRDRRRRARATQAPRSAPRRDGDRHRPVERLLPDRAVAHTWAADDHVGQGQRKRRRVPEDRLPQPAHDRRRRTMRRARAQAPRHTDRRVADPARRPPRLSGDRRRERISTSSG